MAFVKFYIDKPFDPSIEKEKLKAIVDSFNKKKKNYPKSILNVRLTSIYLFFTYGKGQRIKAKTNFKTKAEHWNFDEGCFRSQMNGSLEQNNDLNELATSLLKNFSRYIEDKSSIREEEIKELVQSVINGNVVVSKNTFDKSVEDFYKRKKNILTEGTFKEYRTVFKSLKEYEQQTGSQLKFEDFDQGFFNDYEQFMVTRKNPYDDTRGLFNDTIAKYISTIKSFLYWCHESGYINNVDHLSKIKSKIKRRGKNEIVALTEVELFKIYNHDFTESPRLDRARDLFCFACFTGQRFSDIMRFGKDDFDGNIWEFTSFKTKKKVIVPFEGFIKNALPILEKYDYLLPTLSNQKLNDYLKEVGEQVGIDSCEKITRFSGVKEFIIKNPKYKFMSSHMGRRTFVTLMLEKGVPITIVQKLTQHSDLRTLLKYEGHSKGTLINSLKTT